MNFWKNKRVLVTGGNGFLGKHLIKKLRSLGCFPFYPCSKEYDLRNFTHIQKLLSICRPEIVIHAAAICGGIEANRLRPGTFFYDNAIMGIQLIEESRKAGVDKFVALGTVCAYPKFTPVPFKEEDIWNGYPEETNAPYGLAKKMLLAQLQAYRQQHGFHGVYLVPVNLYGPGDNFNLVTSHVIPAMIRKMLESKMDRNDVILWGNGESYREFLYVEDCVEGILLGAEKVKDSEPVNLGSGTTISIAELAALIQEETGFDGKIIWDSSRPNGQPLRNLDVSKAKKFGFQAKTSLREGLAKTISWYKDLINKVDTLAKAKY